MTEIIDSGFGGSGTYAPINGIIDYNSGDVRLFAPRLGSIGFNGSIPNIKSSKVASSINVGDYVYLVRDPNTYVFTVASSSTETGAAPYLVTKFLEEEPVSTSCTIGVIANQEESFVQIANSTTVYYLAEDWINRDAGTNGWLISSGGNAIFNNVAVRGEINATSGAFSGYMSAGNLKIGVDVNSSNDGIYINSDNYWYDTGSFRVKSTETSGPYTSTTTLKLTDGTSDALLLDSYHRQVQSGLDVIIGLNLTATSSQTKIYTYYGPESSSYTLVGFNWAGNDKPFGVYQSTSEAFTSPTTKFEIDRNGNTTIAGTLGVTGSTSLNGGSLNGTFSGSPILSGKVVFSNTTDVGLTAGAYSVAIGDITAEHMRIDKNEIQIVSGSSASALNLNKEGGQINLGSATSTPVTRVFGDLRIGASPGTTYKLELDGSALISQNLRITGDISTVTNITATADIFATQFRATGGGGSASEVAFGFDADSGFNSGLFYITENSWGMSSGGTERLRFNTAGSIIMHGGTDLSDSIPASTSSGAAILYSGQILAAVQLNNNQWEGGGVPLTLQRASDTAALRDGNLVSFYRQGTLQGTISVLSTTVDYNSFAGSHWSQFKNNEMLDIYRGTVLELIDEKCEWYDSDGNLEENEQLMKVKISDTESSAGVYGVFHRYEAEDPNNPSDMRVMSLGAYIIRISSGETVSIGDLLESAGNGCARVQNDNVIKSSTIAKVTGTAVVETYPDGSYTIPCVLYCG